MFPSNQPDPFLLFAYLQDWKQNARINAHTHNLIFYIQLKQWHRANPSFGGNRRIGKMYTALLCLLNTASGNIYLLPRLSNFFLILFFLGFVGYDA